MRGEHDLASSGIVRSMAPMDKLPPPPPPPPPGRGRGSKRPDDSSADRRHGERTPANQNKGKTKNNEVNADGTPSSGRGPGSWPRWTIFVMLGVLAAALLVPTLLPSNSGESLE